MSTCATCRFFDNIRTVGVENDEFEVVGTAIVGSCHALPPKPRRPRLGGVAPARFYPAVSEKDWCGLWQSKTAQEAFDATLNQESASPFLRKIFLE